MVGGGRFVVSTVAALAVVLSLGACAGEVEAPTSVAERQVTLAQSKSYAQLLRNEASSRLPEIVLKQVAESTDVSIACDADPAGLLRSWTSTMKILVTNSTAARVQQVADDLAATFVEQGWKADLAEESTDTLVVTRLRSATSLADMAITATSKATDQVPSIQVTATGVCALTGGPESDEVTKLEQDAANAG
ncbi:hypothetical protein GCM10027413_31050 [Conyzicola nivalis]|uniref:Uncharacterized protein n=1 Tax=Conyzicola nivalis TaxID=1477021 RepID=A0A916WLT4_9MICO|nr:hypothetical protein [Conyzicola nivalis]GGB12435.1 hypothetical protein GCM10010979_28470 [Conyzicola nivalis]